VGTDHLQGRLHVALLPPRITTGMSATTAQHVVDPTLRSSVAGQARLRRWDQLLRHFPDLADMRVLDLGGTPNAWQLAPVRPAQVTLVNLRPPREPIQVGMTSVVGDACSGAGLGNEIFDLVYSNSLLEHVGGHVQRQRLADVVRTHGRAHWVQTPYRYFPLEPHWLFPGLQFLPHSARVRVSQVWHVGHIRTRSRAAAERAVSGVELIGVTQLRQYFPDSQIWRERFAGLTKSLVAVG
jgi:hypothetical protein